MSDRVKWQTCSKLPPAPWDPKANYAHHPAHRVPGTRTVFRQRVGGEWLARRRPTRQNASVNQSRATAYECLAAIEPTDASIGAWNRSDDCGARHSLLARKRRAHFQPCAPGRLNRSPASQRCLCCAALGPSSDNRAQHIPKLAQLPWIQDLETPLRSRIKCPRRPECPPPKEEFGRSRRWPHCIARIRSWERLLDAGQTDYPVS